MSSVLIIENRKKPKGTGKKDREYCLGSGVNHPGRRTAIKKITIIDSGVGFLCKDCAGLWEQWWQDALLNYPQD